MSQNLLSIKLGGEIFSSMTIKKLPFLFYNSATFSDLHQMVLLFLIALDKGQKCAFNLNRF